MFWKAHTHQDGEYIHILLFVSEKDEGTFTGVGELTMRQPQWDDLRNRLDPKITLSTAENDTPA